MPKISVIRTYLMGVAILWIMVFHARYFFVLPSLGFLQKTGYLGVDIFFFVSSYGLYYSMNRPQSLGKWYLRRMKRILPEFWMVSIFLGIMLHWGIYEHLREEIFFGFFLPWTNQDRLYNVVFWYIPAALVFYLLYPLFYKYKKVITIWYVPIVVAAFFVATMTSSFLSSKGWSPIPSFLIERIPVFLLGMIVADNEAKFWSKDLRVSLVVISIFAFILLYCHEMGITSLLSFPCDVFFLMAFSLPFICYCCTLLHQYVRVLNPFIHYCGKFSLELYLLHVAFVEIIPHYPQYLDSINPNYKFLSAFLLPFPCAYLLKKGISTVIK